MWFINKPPVGILCLNKQRACTLLTRCGYYCNGCCWRDSERERERQIAKLRARVWAGSKRKYPKWKTITANTQFSAHWSIKSMHVLANRAVPRQRRRRRRRNSNNYHDQNKNATINLFNIKHDSRKETFYLMPFCVCTSWKSCSSAASLFTSHSCVCQRCANNRNAVCTTQEWKKISFKFFHERQIYEILCALVFSFFPNFWLLRRRSGSSFVCGYRNKLLLVTTVMGPHICWYVTFCRDVIHQPIPNDFDTEELRLRGIERNKENITKLTRFAHSHLWRISSMHEPFKLRIHIVNRWKRLLARVWHFKILKCDSRIKCA